jgi:hypothetical protein
LLKATLGQKADATKPGEFILTMLEESGVNQQSWERFNEVIKYTSKISGRGAMKNAHLMNFSKIVVASLARVDKTGQKVFWKAHKLHFKLDDSDMGKKGKSGAFKTTNVVAQFMCFSSGIVMHTFEELGARSIILASVCDHL